MAERAQIEVTGIVQGVGFRPFVYGLARSMGLKGYVANTSDGVSIDVEGDGIPLFIQRLVGEAPPLSKISDYRLNPLPVRGYPDFRILESRVLPRQDRFTLISPDVSVCGDCLKELFDPADRRYRYPFINCTNCGPRYTITKSIPYDRKNTTMAPFRMCPECEAEYADPADRRFHAEPNACPACGPRLEFREAMERGFIYKAYSSPLEKAVQLLKEGGILALKGLGGFHLACCALNEKAISLLRERKRRSNKPFALMAKDTETVDLYCEVSEAERELLQSIRRPIVLLKKKKDCGLGAVSPNNAHIGFMLPYTPLHYLLAAGMGSPLVMTSGNLAEEPIIKDNEAAVERLASLVDGFLLHDRDIYARADDTVLRVRRGRNISFIRRSRGYAPEPVPLPSEGPDVLGVGADLKNAFTVTKGGFAVCGQHTGDMENYETLKAFEENLEHMKNIYRVEPAALAHDLHPEYLSTKWALSQGIPKYAVQHHYAHILSVMAEHGLREKVIGVAFDGTGYGTDGNLWGGEFLVCGLNGFERAAHFKYVPLPGGQRAIKEPWRTAVSYAASAFEMAAPDILKRLGFFEKYGKENTENLTRILSDRQLSPLSSGTGRLFDAVSALMGLCGRNTFEGEAAIALESLVQSGIDDLYPFKMENGIVDFAPAIRGIAEDVLNPPLSPLDLRGDERGVISTKFHNTVCAAALEMSMRISREHGLNAVALSGGSFQNIYLLERTASLLEAAGLKVFANEKVPANDGGLSLGQAYLIRERLKDEAPDR